MNAIYFILQIIPFMMLVIIALSQIDIDLFRKISFLIIGKMKITSGHCRKKPLADKVNPKITGDLS